MIFLYLNYPWFKKTLRFQFLAMFFIVIYFKLLVYHTNHLWVQISNLQFLLIFACLQVLFSLTCHVVFDDLSLSLVVVLSIDNLLLNCSNFIHHYFGKNRLLFQIKNHPNLKNFILVYYFIHYLVILPSKNHSKFRFSYLTINFIYFGITIFYLFFIFNIVLITKYCFYKLVIINV